MISIETLSTNHQPYISFKRQKAEGRREKKREEGRKGERERKERQREKGEREERVEGREMERTEEAEMED